MQSLSIRHSSYLRTTPGDTSRIGLCTRRVTGGKANCYWGPVGATAWRPGTMEVWNSGENRAPGQIFRIESESIVSVPAPFFHRLGFSEDGTRLWFDGPDDLWLAASADLTHATRIEVGSAYSVKWVGADRLAVITPDGDRPGKLTLVDMAGKVTEIGKALPDRAGGALAINSAYADPTGRYVAVNYGLSGSTWHGMGSALYDLKSRQWNGLAGDGSYVHGWIGTNQLLMISSGLWFLYNPETGKRTAIDGIRSVQFGGASADGDWLLFTSNNTVQLYQVSTKRLRPVETGGRGVWEAVWVCGAGAAPTCGR